MVIWLLSTPSPEPVQAGDSSAQFWAALLGAVVGGLFTLGGAFLAVLFERRARAKEGRALLRNEVTRSFVSALWAHMAERTTQTIAGSQRELAMLCAVARSGPEAGVREFATRALEGIEDGHFSLRDDGDGFRWLVAEPLLQWGTGDPTFPNGWFEKRIRVPRAEFIDASDIEPDDVRRRMRSRAEITRRPPGLVDGE